VSRGSSVSIVSGYVLDERAIGVRSPPRAKDFSSNLCVQNGSGTHPASCQMGTGGPFPGGKARTGSDADHSPSSSAEIENEYELYILSPQAHPWRVVTCVMSRVSQGCPSPSHGRHFWLCRGRVEWWPNLVTTRAEGGAKRWSLSELSPKRRQAQDTKVQRKEPGVANHWLKSTWGYEPRRSKPLELLHLRGKQ
jgi:hypothetical protein